ncbi:DUF397 domain-containing protein [Streptomyces chumphonensis]|uniref:DUF397 domain-containing protein n=1 Tax=Streptomyces chumphonensis TaxID=1214925 RepID=UPI003D725FF2
MNTVSTSAIAWRKSSYSTNGGNCLEVGYGASGAVPVRDSKDPRGPVLTFSADDWTAFVAGVSSDQLCV